MTIERSDLAIFKPEMLGDNDEAGGQRTNDRVTSGLLNDLFGPISDIDHAQSAVQIVKCYPALDTAATEQLVGAHVFINKPPVDPLVAVLIVESDDLNDNSRMPEMIDILESGVTAGALIQNAGPEFLELQNSFLVKYLTRNESGTNITTNLNVGEVIAIAVEYTGSESATWPRKTHFAKVVSVNGTTPSSQVVFEPAIDFAAPGPTVNINGQTGCTKIRRTNSVLPIKYHGVSALTAIAAISATVLPITKTKESIIPAVAVQEYHLNLTPNVGGLIKKNISQTANPSRTYTFSIPDMLTANGAIVTYTDTTGTISNVATVTAGIGSAVVVLAMAPMIGTPVTLGYVSSDIYQNYSYLSVFPVGKRIVKSTVNSSVLYGSTRLSATEFEDGFYIYDNATFQYLKAGVLNYLTGVFTPAGVGFTAFQYSCYVETPGSITEITFPLGLTTFIMDSFDVRVTSGSGSLLSASANSSGVITGTSISGTIIDGIVSLDFAVGVDANTIVYDVIEVYESLPPAEIFNIDPLRMPNNGIVDIFHKWGVVAIQHSNYQTVASPAPGQNKTIRANARFADITDANGASLWTALNTHYTVNLVAGTVVINSNFPGFTAPFTLTDTIGELGLAVTINDTSVEIASGLTREYPSGSTVASVQDLGDLQARVGLVRDMTSWNNNWDLDGTPATANLNTAAYPIVVNNKGTINEDWVIIFTTTTAFRLVGKSIGQVATGDTLNDFVPINNIVGQPYFRIEQEAFGGGWSAGEAIRFETFAAAKPIMLVRVVSSGHSQITTDRAIISFRGNEA